MIRIENIDYQYSKHGKRVFSDLSLQVPQGRICGLLGKNGAGKSTLLYLISGLLRAQKGQIEVNGFRVGKQQAEVLSQLFLVPEEFDLPAITLDSYVRVNAPFYPHFDRQLMEDCLADFNLPASLNLGQLSMGEKKKVFMCFALAAQTPVLLMDEPTNGMDIPSKSQFRKVMSRCMNDERILIISTHQVKDVELLLDQIIILHDSQVLLNADTQTITDRLAFKVSGLQGEPSGEVLYSQPTVLGQAVVMTNPDDECTPLDLELLFNATLSNPEGIQLTVQPANND